MRATGWRRPAGLLVLLPLLLAACAEARLASHVAKRVQAGETGDTPAAPIDAGAYKVGRPYQIKGVWYYPKVDADYDETGIASWYGHPFHGRATANGAIYDMNALTAAHKTLPMPTRVRVTNLENGRSLVMTVNDRGPFVHGRVIDVSRRGAQLLGFYRQGTAKVRVTVLGGAAPTYVAEKVETPPEKKKALPALPQAEVTSATLPPPPGVKEAEEKPKQPAAPAPPASADDKAVPQPTAPSGDVQYVPVSGHTDLYVQAGAFISAMKANVMRVRLGYIGPTRVTTVFVDGQEMFRVRIGPLPTVERADSALADVIQAGVSNARIVVD